MMQLIDPDTSHPVCQIEYDKLPLSDCLVSPGFRDMV